MMAGLAMELAMRAWMMTAAGLIMFWFWSSGCASKPRIDAPLLAAQEAARAEIRAELSKYYADLSARKWNAFATHFWPGATITTVWQPPGEPAERVTTVTVPEFIASAPMGPDSKPIFEERLTACDIRIDNDLA